MTVVDFDYISKSNLNRQILYSNSDKDRAKAEIATEYINKNFPDINIDFLDVKIDSKSEMKIG